MKRKTIVTAALCLLMLLAAACGGTETSAPQALPAPEGLTYADGTLTWNAVDGAVGYTVELDGEEHDCDAPPFDVTPYTDGAFTARVKANGDGTAHLDSPYSPLIEAGEPAAPAALSAPEGLAYADGTLTWNAVDGAVGYTVRVNGEERAAAGTSLALGAADRGELSVCVKANGDGTAHLDSPYSAPLSVYVRYQLEAPARFRFSAYENALKWEPSADAAGYAVTVNGETISLSRFATSLSAASFGETFTAGIRAVADPDTHYDSSETVVSVTADRTVTDIADEAGLRAMAPDGLYRLTADITLTSAWTPLDFWGTLDGDGHTVRNVEIAADGREAGFFGALLDAHVSDLTLEDVTISGTGTGLGYAGGFAGVAAGSQVRGCKVVGADIDVTNYHAGGFIGSIADGPVATVEDCSAEGSVTVTGGGYAGGFVATVRTNTASVSRCGAAGSVKGGLFAGGFAGHIGYGAFEDCYARAAVSASESGAAAGGFVGQLDGRNVTVRTAYAAGAVTAPEDAYAGGFAGIVPTGQFTGGNIFTYCYYDGTAFDGDRIGNASVGRGDGITSSTSLSAGRLPGGFSDTVWTAEAGAYPELL